MNDKPSYDTRNGKREMPVTAPKPPMVLTLTYDPATHSVKIEGHEHFNQWSFVSAICGMAQELAKFNNNLGMMQGVQQAQMQEALRQQAAQQAAQQIKGLVLGQH